MIAVQHTWRLGADRRRVRRFRSGDRPRRNRRGPRVQIDGGQARELLGRRPLADGVNRGEQRDQIPAALVAGEVPPEPGLQVDAARIADFAVQVAADPLAPASLAVRQPLRDQRFRLGQQRAGMASKGMLTVASVL